MTVFFLFALAVSAVLVSYAAVKVVLMMSHHLEQSGIGGDDEYFLPIGPARCEACGGFCDGDLEKCFENMESEDEDKGGIIPAHVLEGLGKPWHGNRANRGHSVSVEVHTSSTSISVRGNGDVSIRIDEREESMRLSLPPKGTFKPSRIRSD